ncbi:MAG: LLM class flavin-dependent oxidoreductase [Chloroflexi bacterium]|nr:LLM class flavin-dependent oxidoreductase [Chloroflexota bacterium]MDA1226672.1 LLM class flavin-dependent oxidoreductase [Chloroflexota bacterium]
MRFAIMTHLPWPEGKEPRKVLDETIKEVQHGEALGFDSAWFAEHHFTRYGLGSSSMLIAAGIAAQTSTIRLGLAVLVPPLHNPIRLAEDTATLDLMSNGRLDVGFGRGAARYEFVPFGIDPSDTQERFQESVNMIEGMWTKADYSHKGQFYSVDKANLVPQVVQQPHPPSFIAATRTQATLEYAVSKGWPTMVGLTMETAPAIELCQRYASLSAEAGFNVPSTAIPFFRHVYVAPTEEQVREDTQTSLQWMIDMLQWRGRLTEGSEIGMNLDHWRNTRTEEPQTYEHVRENRSVMGTPEQCIAQIKEMQKQGIGYFGCNFSFGGMDHGKILASMKLFSEEVMPYV